MAWKREHPTPNNLSILQLKISEAQRLIRNAKSNSWKQFCDSIDSSISSSEMWRRMKWIKGFKSKRASIDTAKAEFLLEMLAPDYVCPNKPSFQSQNNQLTSKITLQELVNSIKSTDTCPGDDHISFSMVKHLPSN